MWSGSSSSLPADLPDRLYLRVFDPEPAGTHDTRYGRSRDADRDALPPLGRRGRLTGAPAPAEVADGAPPAAGPGGRRPRRRPGDRRAPLRRGEPDRRRLGDAGAVHRRRRRAGRRPRLLPARRDRRGRRLRQRLHRRGEPVARPLRPGAGGASSSPTSRPIRWREGSDPTEVRFTAPEGAALRLQSFDGAEGEIALVSTFGESRLPASGQDEWRARRVRRARRHGGDHAARRQREPERRHAGAPRRRPARRSPSRCRRARRRDASRPVAVGAARPLANCTSVAFDASASTGDGPLGYRWRFGDGAESDEPVIAHAFAAPGRYQAELEVLGRGDARRPRRPRHGAGARPRRAGRGRRATR